MNISYNRNIYWNDCISNISIIELLSGWKIQTEHWRKCIKISEQVSVIVWP